LADREQDWISPGARHAWIFQKLLERGIAVAGVDVGESYGSPTGRAGYDKFYDLLVGHYAFSPKPGLLAISRGGLMAYNWAAEHPDRVRCLGAIYPVCNLRAYPRIAQLAGPYAMSEDKLRETLSEHNPLDRLGRLAAARVPLLHLHGDRDTVVPLESHSAELARRYRSLGGEVELHVVSGKGHEVIPEFWQDSRLIDFFVKHLAGR
jgi:dipeptidyl aminopeptidase/acylaminoacyl peptidase